MTYRLFWVAILVCILGAIWANSDSAPTVRWAQSAVAILVVGAVAALLKAFWESE